MSTRIKVEMQPVNRIVTRLGVDKQGDVQMQLTRIISNRIYKYIPRRGGVLEKSKYITSPTTIEVIQPYAAYQYFGKVMVGPPPKVATDKDLTYDTTKKALAGPKWDQRMMAAEGAAICAEIQAYVDRRGKK